MKFEIDPNELTTDQRAHVAAFITDWPTLAFKKMNNIAPLPRNAHIVEEDEHGVKFVIPTEEQRLDAEQKSDLEEADTDNLNAIFGTPDVVKQMQENIVEVEANLNSLVPLDSQGLPWDSRIHASTKTFIADGSWKLRRGVDPAEVEKVKAQLKGLMAVPTAPAPVLTPTSVGYVPVPPAPVIIPQLAEIVPPAPKSHYLIDQVPTVTLTDLIGRMSAAITAGKLTQASIAEICTKHGVSEFHLLSNRPDLLPLIDADMKAMGV